MNAAPFMPRARQVILFNAAFWLAVTVFHNAEAAISGMRVDWPAILGRMATGTLGVTLSSILAWVGLRSAGADLRLRLRPVLGTAVLLALFFSATDYFLWYVVLAERPPLGLPVMLALHWSFRLSFLLACYGLYFAIFYATALHERENRLLEARAQAQQAKLRALRYQVNPHLLFNALNALSALVVTGQSRAAGEMIEKLARFYRAALAPEATQKVPLAKEIELQTHYLDVERTRFPDRVRFHTDVAAGLEQALVPHLLLQPLIENSVRHGMATTYEPIEIRLRARREAGTLLLSLDNNGPPVESGASADRVGLGIANVRERLRVCYGDSGALSTDAPPAGGFRVEMRMPLELTL